MDELVVANNRAIKDVVANLQAISAEVQLMFGDSSAGEPGDIVSAVQSVKDISQNLSEVSSALKDITSRSAAMQMPGRKAKDISGAW